MPTPQIPSIPGDANVQQLRDGIIGINRYLNYLLSSLDTLNINRLDAKVIKTGTLDANLVTIRSDLVGSSYLQLDGNGIRANNGTINTFEINTDGNAFFRGNITSEAIITGALIQTAATGRRIALIGDELQSLDTSTLDGFTLEGSTGSLGWYNSGVKTGSITRDSTQPYEQFLFSHDYLLLSGTLGIDLPSASITIGNVGGDIYMVGNTSFSGTTVTGLITNTIVDHNHGVTPGRYLKTYDSGGLELGLQLFSASGGHSHTVLAS